MRRGSIEVSSGTVAKNVSASAGDTRKVNSIPGSRRSPRVGNGNLLQYTCLKNFTDRDAGWVMVYGVSKRWIASSSKQRMLAKSGDFQSFLITMTMSVSQSVSSVARSCPTLCDPMNRSTLGLPVHHKVPEFTQTHAHRVGDAIQPSHPVVPFSSCPQSLQVSGSFPMSQLFA